MLTDERLGEIRSRLDHATPGRFTARRWPARRDQMACWEVITDRARIATECYERDAELFAHAKDDLADLLDEVSELRRTIRMGR